MKPCSLTNEDLAAELRKIGKMPSWCFDTKKHGDICREAARRILKENFAVNRIHLVRGASRVPLSGSFFSNSKNNKENNKKGNE